MSATAWWTAADSGEMDALVWELCRSYFEHRQRCRSCSPFPCPVLTRWRSHLEECKACRGDAPLTYGLPCERYHEFIAHGDSCRRCNPCPALRTAIEVIVDWRDTRELLSRAEFLRGERAKLEGWAA
jgi:hypothetical protein